MTNRNIGARIRAVREARKMTTTALARRAGISQAQISRLENGRQGFRSGTLVKIAKALGETPFFFMMNDRQWEAYGQGSRLKKSARRPEQGPSAAITGKIDVAEEVRI